MFVVWPRVASRVGCWGRGWLAGKVSSRGWRAGRKGFGAALGVWLARKREGFGAALGVWLARKRKGFGAGMGGVALRRATPDATYCEEGERETLSWRTAGVRRRRAVDRLLVGGRTSGRSGPAAHGGLTARPTALRCLRTASGLVGRLALPRPRSAQRSLCLGPALLAVRPHGSGGAQGPAAACADPPQRAPSEVVTAVPMSPFSTPRAHCVP